MKKYFFTLLIIASFISVSQEEGPLVLEKLELPEEIVKKYIQKRSTTWIQGQWKVKDNQYIWVSGHWVKKRIGYHFINGKWMQKENGWVWVDGYWEQIPIKKWQTLYS